MNRKIDFDQNCEIASEACREAHAQLSGYVDNTLSARQMWDVEKHLSACPACAVQAQQMQITVELLRTATRRDTNNDFMARLHARLDGVEPEIARAPSVSARLRDWVARVQESLRVRSTPAFNMTLALAGVAALLILPQLPQGVSVAPTHSTVVSIISQPTQQALDRHVADVAGDPLGDVAAAKLTAHLNPGEDNTGSLTE